MDNNELYHYGVPGMRWGVRKNTSKHDSKPNPKPKLSKKAKIAIGATAASVALAGIGTMLAKETIQKQYIIAMVAKAFRDNML